MPLTVPQKEILNRLIRGFLDEQTDFDALRKIRAATNAQFSSVLTPKVQAMKASTQAVIASLSAVRAAQDAQLAQTVADCDAVLAALAAGDVS